VAVNYSREDVKFRLMSKLQYVDSFCTGILDTSTARTPSQVRWEAVAGDITAPAHFSFSCPKHIVPQCSPTVHMSSVAGGNAFSMKECSIVAHAPSGHG
jgi:hypothetical protein